MQVIGPVLVFKEGTLFDGTGGHVLHFSSGPDRKRPRYFFGYEYVREVYDQDGKSLWKNWDYAQDKSPIELPPRVALWLSERTMYSDKNDKDTFKLFALSEEDGVSSFGMDGLVKLLESIRTSTGVELWTPKRKIITN